MDIQGVGTLREFSYNTSKNVKKAPDAQEKPNASRVDFVELSESAEELAGEEAESEELEDSDRGDGNSVDNDDNTIRVERKYSKEQNSSKDNEENVPASLRKENKTTGTALYDRVAEAYRKQKGMTL